MHTFIERYLNDFYALDLRQDDATLQWAIPHTYGKAPTARESHSAVFFNSDGCLPQLIIYGGMAGRR